MLEFPLLTLLQAEDLPALRALGAEPVLAQLVALIEARLGPDAATIERPENHFSLGSPIAKAPLVAVDRGLIAWALAAPSAERFEYVIDILRDMWQVTSYAPSVEAETLRSLVALRRACLPFSNGAERFIRLIARLIEKSKLYRPETVALAIDTALALPQLGFVDSEDEAAYRFSCAPLLRARGIEPPSDCATFLPHLRSLAPSEDGPDTEE